VADREFVFSNPEVQKLIREKFVPLAMDDWYLRRQQDEHGKFFREMTRESPRGNAGDNTRQGRYVFTATGKFLGFNNNRGPERILAMLRDALAKWERLPDAERKPAPLTDDVKLQPQYDRTPPKGGAVVKVYTRVLDRAADGTLTACTPPPREEGNFQHRGLAAAVDHLWLTADDIQSLLPDKNAKPGAATPLPRALAQRIARFHLTDSTRGEPPHWRRDEVKSLTLTLTPETANRARLSGSFHLETKDGQRGCTGRLDGWLEHKNGKLTAFQAAATGEHSGDGPFTRGSRPGKSPIGFAFVLCADPKPADAIPPQAARWLEGYYDPDRN
jgi:hypothetical protein